MFDWSAALGPDARRLEPRLARVTPAPGRGLAFLTVHVDARALTDAETRWVAERETRRDGASVWRLTHELALGFPSGAAWLADELPLARALRALAAIADRPRAAPKLFGIVNVTPDSFSDGGQFLDPERAVEHGLALVADGADVLDVGGESTRPGAEPVSEKDELARVVPVIAALSRRTTVPISVDTTKSSVARAALDAGARIVNDISAGRFDAAMLPLVAERGAGFVLMHIQGTPRDMQHAPSYTDVLREVVGFLRERAASCVAAGIAPERLVVDPGIGFGKALEHNVELLRRTSELRSLGCPVLVGASRKSFVARIEEAAGIVAPGAARLGGSIAAACAAARGGADFLRVHDVRETAQAVRVLFAIG
ncbi:MAG: dihydropteroate synthase [Planctomycetes bacterium]|nr:dihydropteroate synthase [Planctomycetota bacterium]